MAFLSPLLLALFRYNPPRYYLAVVPAALLLVVEWLRLYPSRLRRQDYHLSPLRLAVGAVLLLPLTASLFGFVGSHLIPVLPFVPQGEDPGIDYSTLIEFYPVALLAAVVTAGILARGQWLRPAVVAGIAEDRAPGRPSPPAGFPRDAAARLRHGSRPGAARVDGRGGRVRRAQLGALFRSRDDGPGAVREQR